MEGPEILKFEVIAALIKKKTIKAAGPDGIVIEMLSALNNFNSDKITEIINEIYNSVDILENLGRP